jgi:hypothetical protein
MEGQIDQRCVQRWERERIVYEQLDGIRGTRPASNGNSEDRDKRREQNSWIKRGGTLGMGGTIVKYPNYSENKRLIALQSRYIFRIFD